MEPHYLHITLPLAAPGTYHRLPDRKDRALPVVNTLELEGVSTESWGEAAREALREAAMTIRNITKMDVVHTSATVNDQGISEFRTEVRIFFEVESRG